MPEQITISTISPNRWQEYRDLRIEALKTEPLAYASSPEDNANLTERNWRSYLESETNPIFFAQLNNQLIGNTTVVRETKPKLCHIANIYGVYVKPQYRGQKVGKQLLQHAIDFCKQQTNLTKIKISVNPAQTPALKLYHKLGFRLVGEYQQELYINGQFYSEYIMEKLLTEKI